METVVSLLNLNESDVSSQNMAEWCRFIANASQSKIQFIKFQCRRYFRREIKKQYAKYRLHRFNKDTSIVCLVFAKKSIFPRVKKKQQQQQQETNNQMEIYKYETAACIKLLAGCDLNSIYTALISRRHDL